MEPDLRAWPTPSWGGTIRWQGPSPCNARQAESAGICGLRVLQFAEASTFPGVVAKVGAPRKMKLRFSVAARREARGRASPGGFCVLFYSAQQAPERLSVAPSKRRLRWRATGAPTSQPFCLLAMNRALPGWIGCVARSAANLLAQLTATGSAVVTHEAGAVPWRDLIGVGC